MELKNSSLMEKKSFINVLCYIVSVYFWEVYQAGTFLMFAYYRFKADMIYFVIIGIRII